MLSLSVCAAEMMVGLVTSLLLLPLITAGYDISSPCQAKVCFHLWRLLGGYKVGLVSNGKMVKVQAEDECSVRVKELEPDDAGLHRCGVTSDELSAERALPEAPVLNLIPGRPLTLQCVLLSYINSRTCGYGDRFVALWWVDGSGEKITPDAEHRIREPSACNTTLTVTFQNLQTRTYRCQAMAGQGVETSVELQVRVQRPVSGRQGPKITEEDIDEAGTDDNPRGVFSTVAAVLGFVAMTTLVALMVNIRRKKTHNASTLKPSVNEVSGSEEVIYADIVLPVVHSRLIFTDEDATEYASVRYS